MNILMNTLIQHKRWWRLSNRAASCTGSEAAH
jgi:hypothetical protein